MSPLSQRDTRAGLRPEIIARLDEIDGQLPDLDARALNAKKERARKAVQDAVRLGRIAKPDHCARCSRVVVRRALQGHHADYDRPLDVEWLCQQCHQADTNARRMP